MKHNFKKTEQRLQAKLAAKSKQHLPQKIHALQTTKNVFHEGFEEL